MKDTDKLELLPFTQEEKNRQYTLNTFLERGKEFSILRDNSSRGISSGTLYKFGVINDNGDYFWFLDGKVFKGRKTVQQIFNQLDAYCKAYQVGKPFAMKKKT